jgi:tetratricopeptide (TPR) repeat protein
MVVATMGTASLASSVTELVLSGERQERAGEPAVAARKYTEALALDPCSEEAYLHLGLLRLRTGDPRESARVFSVALARIPSFDRAYVERAAALWALGNREEAERDLELYLTRHAEDRTITRRLASWYAAHGRYAPELALWRRLATLAEGATETSEAQTMVQALQALLAELDPVSHPPKPSSNVRNLLARAARSRP